MKLGKNSKTIYNILKADKLIRHTRETRYIYKNTYYPVKYNKYFTSLDRKNYFRNMNSLKYLTRQS